jgi:hypothetical protein
MKVALFLRLSTRRLRSRTSIEPSGPYRRGRVVGIWPKQRADFRDTCLMRGEGSNLKFVLWFPRRKDPLAEMGVGEI